ncbi:hypothetical protein EC912_10582 [Luteibacter rhizovicinus]|uniref:N-acetyltransferase domain-containing protein n=1 Tax=Luteibacter rhizovicinus TaxID=242606 RepID=A0A4R3YM04_9GAMM|nr:GNAT family N-acetyltransferase [Luteibacter rhizovicinus]TCV93222.1 hypothetical protein EC912_10582 [Luteibacter rhizovicinus]
MSAQPLEIVHDTANQAFKATVEEQVSVLEYQLRDKIMTITHTGVPQALGGRGIASALTLFAAKTAEAAGWKIIPACSYASTWFRRHPEYDKLLT